MHKPKNKKRTGLGQLWICKTCRANFASRDARPVCRHCGTPQVGAVRGLVRSWTRGRGWRAV